MRRHDESESGPERRPASVDEQMVRDWARIGIRRLERMLALNAEFDDYLRRRGDEEGEGSPS